MVTHEAVIYTISSVQLNFAAPQGDWKEDVSSRPNEIVERDY